MSEGEQPVAQRQYAQVPEPTSSLGGGVGDEYFRKMYKEEWEGTQAQQDAARRAYLAPLHVEALAMNTERSELTTLLDTSEPIIDPE